MKKAKWICGLFLVAAVSACSPPSGPRGVPYPPVSSVPTVINNHYYDDRNDYYDYRTRRMLRHPTAIQRASRPTSSFRSPSYSRSYSSSSSFSRSSSSRRGR